MRRRSQLIPWKAAGRVSEKMASGDDVVRQTGWVFNNATGDELTLAEFVATGDDEVPAYLETFGLRDPSNQRKTLVEIGAGIGRDSQPGPELDAVDVDKSVSQRCEGSVRSSARSSSVATTPTTPCGCSMNPSPSQFDWLNEICRDTGSPWWAAAGKRPARWWALR